MDKSKQGVISKCSGIIYVMDKLLIAFFDNQGQPGLQGDPGKQVFYS